MPQEIKGYVRPPQMPDHLSERGDAIDRVQAPLLIRLFTWLLLRCGISLLFAFLVGLAPDSDVAKYVALHFDVVPPPMPPEAVFSSPRSSMVWPHGAGIAAIGVCAGPSCSCPEPLRLKLWSISPPTMRPEIQPRSLTASNWL